MKKILEQIDQIEKLTNPLSSLSPKPSILDFGYDPAGRILNERSAYAEVLRQNDFASSAVKSALGDLYYYDAVSGLAKGVGSYSQLPDAVHQALPHGLISATVDAVNASKIALGLDSVAYANMFRLPEESEVQKLAAAAALGVANSHAASYVGAVGLADKMTAMHNPWLNKRNMLESVNAFSALQNIGCIANSNAPFDDFNSNNLRQYLGDWRDEIALSAQHLLDTEVRTDYYKDRGFNPQLTQFTEDAFEEGLNIAGLRKKPAVLRKVAVVEIDDEYSRNADAFDSLKEFEIKIRAFVETKMGSTHGEFWIKQNVPGDALARWKSRKSEAEKNGASKQALIRYADFSDYILIIGRNDNWESVFQKIFFNKVNIQESFRRISLVRNTVMHNRPVTFDDELYLLSEITRVFRAIELDDGYTSGD